MRAYASMYRPFRPTAISGHTRLTSGHTRVISGHKMAETYHTITVPACKPSDGWVKRVMWRWLAFTPIFAHPHLLQGFCT